MSISAVPHERSMPKKGSQRSSELRDAKKLTEKMCLTGHAPRHAIMPLQGKENSWIQQRSTQSGNQLQAEVNFTLTELREIFKFHVGLWHNISCIPIIGLAL